MRREALHARKKRGRGLRTVAVLAVFAGLLAGGLVLFRTSEMPTVELELDLPAIGPRTPLTVRAQAGRRGLSRLEVRVRQGQASLLLHEAAYETRPPWAFWGPMTDEVSVDLVLQKDQLPALRTPEATLEAVATGAGTPILSAPTASVARSFDVRLRPPRVAVLSDNVFPAQGGAEVVVYSVSETAVRHGVRAGAYFFPGFPLPDGGRGEYFALFGIPYDLDVGGSDHRLVRLEAEDDVGNVAEVGFVDRFIARPFETDTIQVTDRFMETVVPRIMAKTPELEDKGSLLENYVAINAELRQDNNRTLRNLAKESEERFLWNRPFVQMPAKVVSSFADRRTYLYNGRKIDKQDHLGFDLASVRKAPIPASNSGRVIFADYLGIFGNAVVLDHGYGLQTLYAHLSKIQVQVGERVDRGQTIGRTGATGLALGDHLHFTTLLQGLPVTPIEWWDGHWLHDRLALKLGDALGFQDDGND